MAEYIEREYVVERLRKRYNDPNYWHTGEDWRMGLSLAKDVVDETPTADVVEVVRCKDCGRYNKPRLKYCSLISCYMHFDDFCSYGVRKEGAEE